ncbi:biotin biosynthesis protein BioC [Pararhizobium sp. BT-229]|uniref:biotin biosynthesis protein BioC n=1 Tax=Pararhizobium sp. BT-229 TaxID=2986923 RepID=UPI0021F6C9E1|nr:biotin biosynthesis protein BioC [Pararhizobium sp. BT-229]MCV9965265.1 biotin biosynthesis protein BioC [Pararhizobium sp. BT-229]
MQIANRLTSAASGDGLSNFAGRAATQSASGNREDGGATVLPAGGYDPSSRVSLSAEALLFLGRTKRVQEKYPALTRDEWSNKLSPQLAAREYQAFGKYSETGDHKAYYRAFIEYYDNLRPEDQNSLRYFGTRDAAIAGARSVEYSDESGVDSGATFQTLVSVLLDTDKAQSEFATVQGTGGMITGDMFGWDTGTISYEDVSQTRNPLSEIEKFYQENF